MVISNIFSSNPRSANVNRHTVIYALGILACLSLTLTARHNLVWLALLPVLLFCVDGLFKKNRIYQKEFFPLIITTSVYGLIYFLVKHIPYLWQIIQIKSLAVSEGIGNLTGSGVVLGASASGFWILLAFLIYFLNMALFAHKTNRALALMGSAYLLLVYCFYIGFGELIWLTLDKLCRFYLRSNHLLPFNHQGNAALLAATAPILLFIPGLMIVLFFSKRFDFAALDKKGTFSRRNRKALALHGTALAGFLILTLAPLGNEKQSPRITFYNQGLVDWRMPGFNRFGINQSGMFGLLPEYLKSMGFKTTVMGRQAKVTESLLQQSDVFVIINPTQRLAVQQKSALWRFVADGGALLVLGDHTDIEGIMAPLNDLLSPVAIEFNFDSAFTATRWVNAFEVFPHPIVRGLDFVNHNLQQSTGASIDIKFPAFPIISGKYGFSDSGSRSNVSNGYLGDYRYRSGEQFGDVVVVGGTHYGKGKVLVFGDTSSFQNTAIYHSYEFVGRVFSYLAAADPISVSTRVTVFAILALLYVVLMGFHKTALHTPGYYAVLSTLLFLAWCTSHLVNAHFHRAPNMDGPLAYVDAGHVNQYALEHWQDDSIGGLTLNLARNGFYPLVFPNRNLEAILKAQIFVSIAPAKAFNDRDMDILQKFVESGGLFILSVGWEEKRGCENILALWGLDIAAIPLGPVPIYKKTLDNEIVRRIQMEPHFMEAWPVVSKDQQPVKIFYQTNQFPVIVSKKIGKGGILVIGDSKFLLDKTLEGEKAYWPGNILLLQQIFDALKEDGIGI